MAQTAYRAEIFSLENSKDPDDIFIIFTEDIVEAAIEATKKMKAKKSDKKLRVTKVEEVKGKVVKG